MNDLPYFGLDAVEHNKLPQATKVFYTTDPLSYLYIRVPKEVADSCTLQTVYKVYTGRDIHRQYDEKEVIVDIPEVKLFTHKDKSIWYDFTYLALPSDIGHNIYKLEFNNLVTHKTIILYFAYILTGTPENKTYKYVKEKVNES